MYFYVIYAKYICAARHTGCYTYRYCITPLAWVEIQRFALTINLHVYLFTCLHAYCIACMLTCLHAYVLTPLYVYMHSHGQFVRRTSFAFM